MLRKAERTVDLYMQVGAKMRLLKTLMAHVMADVDKILPSESVDKLSKAYKVIHDIGSKAEDKMFHEHPELSDDYISVFYGSTRNAPSNAVDNEVLQKARDIAESMVKLEHRHPSEAPEEQQRPGKVL